MGISRICTLPPFHQCHRAAGCAVCHGPIPALDRDAAAAAAAADYAYDSGIHVSLCCHRRLSSGYRPNDGDDHHSAVLPVAHCLPHV
ncbi:hypothetical protein, partial [Acinetobacter baumannii]|uniref:hypothetical protein n=1 Tax=Acinetobacter baumannii TaxID=470 RepID=UPI00208F9BEA